MLTFLLIINKETFMSKIQEELEKQHKELRRLAAVANNNRRTINLANQRSFLTQTIQEVSR